MRFELFIAARYLRAKRRQAVVGVITAISVIGVAAGVASLIIALAITNGMRRDMQDRLLGSTAHVDLMRVAADGIREWRPLLDRLRKIPHVTAAAPGLYGQVLISRGARSGGGLIKGVIPADERTVGDLLQKVTEGSAAALEPQDASAAATHLSDERVGAKREHPIPGGADTPERPVAAQAVPPIVIGKDLAETIGAKVGDTVLVTSPQGELTPLGLVPKYQRCQVVGIFSSGFYQYDSSYAFMRLKDTQRLFSEPDLISVISFKVDDLYSADRIARVIEQEAGKGFQTTNWMEQNRELFRALKLEQMVTFIVLALIVCVAALNILIALTMMVMEKTRDIAVLMSFGVTEMQVRRIFLLQGLLISVIGTVLGLILGYGLSWLGGHYRFPLDAAVYSIDHLPFAPRVWDGVIVGAVSLGVSLLATLYPSGSAAKVLPAEALRYE
ncbi:ABC transporter permease [Edaphobacter modestus]|uniref:Lipoprotein-releasing system permease protein n=1 Tax=Edaphobacter modestus TaxID=388466 RepID=A0A4Q7YRI8_9BACT|nr:ABC transporter permease [Edaphobacter modestus]RZU39459.1 lipoprotein-releasing system permease protein [Edaphobacter modestus]